MMNKLGSMREKLRQLARELEGELYDDTTIRTLYATDASAYREMPLAVAVPRSVADIKKLIHFAKEEKTSLIPRTAGTFAIAGVPKKETRRTPRLVFFTNRTTIILFHNINGINDIFLNTTMPAFITEYPQFFTATNLEWKKLLQPDKYKDIIINSFRFLVETNALNSMPLLLCPIISI